MQESWQIVRAELRRKWPIAAILLALYFSVCVGLKVWLRYNPIVQTGGWEEVFKIPMLVFPIIYALIIGVATFQPAEKDGVRKARGAAGPVNPSFST